MKHCIRCQSEGPHVRCAYLCPDCIAALQGRSAIEEHHIVGRNEDTTIPVTANDHAVFTAAQRRWPAYVKEHQGEPMAHILLFISAAAGFAEWCADKLRWVCAWLLALALRLEELHGPDWWQSIGVPPYGTQTGR